MLVDTHCHVYSEYYENPLELLKECKEKGIDFVISDAVNVETCKELLELSKKSELIYITLGIHPEDANVYKKEDLDFIEKNLNDSKVVAIGEIGLDYHYEGYDKEKQLELFENQLKIAEKYNLPVVIHSREATKDTLDTLKKYKVTGVIHSFSGSKETAIEYIKLGYYLGINGVITFKNAKIKDIYKEIGLERIVIETDSPYLTPVPYRGQTNYPYHVNDIAVFLKNEFGISYEELCNITNRNIATIFDKIKR